MQYLAGDEVDVDDDDEKSVGLAAIAFANACLFRSVRLSIEHDFTIDKIGGEHVDWHANYKTFRTIQSCHVENEHGELACKIRDRLAPNHRIVVEDADGGKVGVIPKRGDGSHWCHADDDRDTFAEGDATEWKHFAINKIGGEHIGWHANHKALRIRQFHHVENEDGELACKIRERLVPNHRIVVEDFDGGKVGAIRKRGDGSH